MHTKDLSELKLEIQIQAKNGIDFIISAAIIWLGITFIWTMDITPYNLSIITFMAGAVLLPLAWGISKLIGTNWKVKDNPLQPLGLWLNFAQLIYFPFLIFILIKYPEFFIMAYAIITGAHLFPYAWFYNEIGYAIWAVSISVGTLLITLNVDIVNIWKVPLFTSIMLFLLAFWILLRFKKITNK